MYSSSSYSTEEKLLPNKHIIRVSKSYENNNGVIHSSSDTVDIDPLGKKTTIPYEKGLQMLSLQGSRKRITKRRKNSRKKYHSRWYHN
jgi:hypothetical protein